MLERMGYSRRKEAREIAQAIEEANKALVGHTLESACATGLTMLGVSCQRCPRRGRYRLTRLNDRHGPTLPLLSLKNQLSADCPKKNGSFFK
jgi:hypothetical protein